MGKYVLMGDYLCHYGVKGMKWGVRRYQNRNGTLTSAGKQRYKSSDAESKHLAEKNRRSKLTQSETIAELKKLCNPNIDTKGADFKKYLDLDQEIRTFSGDWYESKGVSKAFSEAIARHEKSVKAAREAYDIASRNSITRHLNKTKINQLMKKWLDAKNNSEDELVGVVLRDLGYKDSPEARELLRGVVIWD